MGAVQRGAGRDLDDELVLWQAARLRGILPLLCIAMALNTLAMAAAVAGDLPLWQQFLPPFIIIATLIVALIWRAWGAAPHDPRAARRQLAGAAVIAATLGAVSGAWGVNAFTETEKYYCMVAPVFLGLSALITASCLLSVPRAAIAAMMCTMVPIVIKMSLYDNLGVRAMAAMAAGLTVLQTGIVLSNFRQSRRNLELRRELAIQAGTDPLTGLANRRAFAASFDALLAARNPIAAIVLDLNGFKQANDSHGHHVGDCILIEVAERLHLAAPSASVVARLGGDEFCILLDNCDSWHAVQTLTERILAEIEKPHYFPEGIVLIGCEIGAALSGQDGDEAAILLAVADQRLYAGKRARADSCGASAQSPLRSAVSQAA